MAKYYLYRHVRIDENSVFYIGIGTKPKYHYVSHRAEYSRAYITKNRNNFWNNIVAKTNYKVEILFESDDYYTIEQKEIEFIALYGRRDLGLGTLCNLTDGGNRFDGQIHQKTAYKRDQEGYVNPLRGTAITDEHKSNLSKSLKRTERSNSRILIDKLNGVFYISYRDAAESLGIPTETMRSYVNGKVKNRTNIVYAESEEDSNYLKSIQQEKPHGGIKKVINTTTGELHTSLKIVMDTYGYTQGHCRQMLNPNGNRRNITPFEYYDEEKHAHLIKNAQ